MLTYRNPNTSRSISPSEFAAGIVKSSNEETLHKELDENTCPNQPHSSVKRQKVSEKLSLSPTFENEVASAQSAPVEKLQLLRLPCKLASPVTKRQVETRKRKLRQSTSSDERGVDSDEEENVIKRRRINALADILTLKKLEHLPIARRIISIHKKDKNRLSGVRKIEKRINKHDAFTWNMRREVLSLPMRTMREQTLEKAVKYKEITAKFKRQAFRRVSRKEENKRESDEDSEYSEAVIKEATAIMHKEVPDLIAAECIINTHKKHKDRLNRTDNNGYARKAYPTKFIRCQHSEPVNLLRLRILNEAEDLRDYTDLRRAAVKMNVKNKLAQDEL